MVTLIDVNKLPSSEMVITPLNINYDKSKETKYNGFLFNWLNLYMTSIDLIIFTAQQRLLSG